MKFQITSNPMLISIPDVTHDKGKSIAIEEFMISSVSTSVQTPLPYSYILVQCDSAMSFNANQGRNTILEMVPIHFAFTESNGNLTKIWRKQTEIGESVFIGHVQSINIALTDEAGIPLVLSNFTKPCFITIRVISL